MARQAGDRQSKVKASAALRALRGVRFFRAFRHAACGMQSRQSLRLVAARRRWHVKWPITWCLATAGRFTPQNNLLIADREMPGRIRRVKRRNRGLSGAHRDRCHFVAGEFLCPGGGFNGLGASLSRLHALFEEQARSLGAFAFAFAIAAFLAFAGLFVIGMFAHVARQSFAIANFFEASQRFVDLLTGFDFQSDQALSSSFL